MMNDDFQKLKEKLKTAWSKESSYEPEKWTAENPSYGQCAITACIVQDVLGGDIVVADYTQPDGVKGQHFFNMVSGQCIDLTRDQFMPDTVIKEPHPSSRYYILSYKSTRTRYEILKSALKRELS